ncbi:MAG: MBL fold metallo-hydrolase [Thermoanaerobaculaceae bacterium]|nr:MBL fold metallo-hydrolase [Thermoanaerobaculaceae bacterium]
MKVYVWGARGSVPCFSKKKSHFGTNTPCVEVKFSKTERIILDAGTGLVSMGNSIFEKTNPREESLNILLSHFHWDHIQGLPFFKPVFQKEASINIYGKEEIEKVFSSQMITPFYPVPFGNLPAKINAVHLDSPLNLLNSKITPFQLNHPQGCIGYRIERDNKVLVYATDTEPDGGKLDEILLEHSKGADLLIMDSNNTIEEAKSRKGWGHSTWVDCVNIAKKANVKKLLLFHHDPFHDDNLVFEKEAEAQRQFRNSFCAFEDMQIEI